jgi:hypothetical protein
MRTILVAFAAAALAAPLSVTSAAAKTLPPAFGTELVPEQSSQEYKGPSAEVEELKEEEKEERAAQRPARPRGGGGGRGGRVRIQLDGDEDGGGGEALDGDF